MVIEYYKSLKGNFGDDLNESIWIDLFGEKLLKDPNTSFFGIGSILYSGNKLVKNSKEKKIVFGSGYRPERNFASIDFGENWDIFFLRGPLSSLYCDNRPFITDAAYVIPLINKYKEYKDLPKKYEVSLMPHYKSVDLFDWKTFCKNCGFNYISPGNEQSIDFTLREFAQSKHVITEAMHGAIISDIFRVPWRRFTFSTYLFETPNISDFKWNDWLLSLNINPLVNIDLSKNDNDLMNFLRKKILKRVKVNSLNDLLFKEDLMINLTKVDDFTLSKDFEYNIALEKIENQIDIFKSKYTL